MRSPSELRALLKFGTEITTHGVGCCAFQLPVQHIIVAKHNRCNGTTGRNGVNGKIGYDIGGYQNDRTIEQIRHHRTGSGLDQIQSNDLTDRLCCDDGNHWE
jgi:hypothetical protein